MTLTATFVALWMVCCVGAVTFASIAGSSRRLLLFGLGMVASTAASWSWGPLDAPITGAAAAGAAALYLWRSSYAPVAVVIGGVLAGMWPWLLEYDPAMTAGTAVVCVVAVVASAWCSRMRPSFAPEVLQDDAVLILLTGGVALSVLPGILDGWQSAVTLNAVAAPAAEANVPVWFVAAIAGSLALGGVHSVWSRRCTY